MINENIQNKGASRKVFWCLLIIIILVFLLIYSIIKLVVVSNELKALQSEISKIESSNQKVETNTNVLNFTKLLIENVLRGDNEEVSFEKTLELENSIRNIKDDEVRESWNKFINSATEQEAQKNIVDLLDILINKIQ